MRTIHRRQMAPLPACAVAAPVRFGRALVSDIAAPGPRCHLPIATRHAGADFDQMALSQQLVRYALTNAELDRISWNRGAS